MTQTISRLYQSRENADAAVAELKQSKFAEEAVSVIAPAEGSDGHILDSIGRAGVSATHAEVYAEGVKRGETLVVVQPLWGRGAKAIRIMQKHSPTDTGLAEPTYERPTADPAAPLSSAAGWPVLLHNPAPLSSLLGMPLLSTHRSSPKLDPELVDNPAPFSKSIGTPVLSDRPTILSSRVGWRVLSDDPAPLSGRLKWPTLSKEQTPPKSRLGLPLLSDDPAPFSKRVGWKVLSKDPAPLSRLFGWRVLSDETRK